MGESFTLLVPENSQQKRGLIASSNTSNEELYFGWILIRDLSDSKSVLEFYRMPAFSYLGFVERCENVLDSKYEVERLLDELECNFMNLLYNQQHSLYEAMLLAAKSDSINLLEFQFSNDSLDVLKQFLPLLDQSI